MKPFSKLSYVGQVKRLKSLAYSALLNYNLGQVRLVSLSHGENTTFKVEVESERFSQNWKETNQWYILRIYRPGKHSIAAIHSELQWLISLRRETDLMIPEPVPTKEGSLWAIAKTILNYEH